MAVPGTSAFSTTEVRFTPQTAFAGFHAGATWLVPVHVFSRDEGRIARFEEAGFKPGLTPTGATLGDFEALHRRFADGLR